MTRIAAREIVVHMIYAQDYTGDMPSIVAERGEPAFYEDLGQEDELYASPPGPDSKAYIESLARGISDHLDELDGYIEKYAVGWSFGRISRIAVAILRVCMYETLYRPDIPQAAAINAAVELCKKYETPEAASFVNGIMGSFVRSEMGA